MAATRGGKRGRPRLNPETTRNSNLKKPKKALDPKRIILAASNATSLAHRFLLKNDLTLLPSQSLNLLSQLNALSKTLSLNFPTSSSFYKLVVSNSNSNANDQSFYRIFRMSKPSFNLLLRLLTPSLSNISDIFPAIALASALFRLAHSASYNTVALLFSMPDSETACKVFYTVCKAIHDRLCHFFEFKSDIKRVVVGFGYPFSLPNCCGVLGFDSFKIEGNNLLDGKGSLLVQALVDSEGRFLDVSAGWPSTMKPDKILRHSKIFAGIETTNEYLTGERFEMSDGTEVPQYVLGDSCFPLLPWLITPYREPEKEAEFKFNFMHKKGMDLVTTAFGRVRETWKILAGGWKEECIEYFPFVVVACCLLHNYLIKSSEEFQFLEEDVEYESDRKLPVFEGQEDDEGKRIRDALASHLNRVRHDSENEGN